MSEIHMWSLWLGMLIGFLVTVTVFMLRGSR
jgi:hypothetical protein